MRVTVKRDLGGATINHNQVSVTDTATQIAAARADRRSLVVVNHGTTDVYIGGSGVTSANGLLLVGVKGASITLQTTAAVYGIVGAGSQTVSFQEDY